MAKALQQNLMTHVKKINIAFTSKFIIISMDVESRTRKGLTHYTRVLIDINSREIIKESCSCEGFNFRKRCWHLSLLKSMIQTS